jgi:IS5 family transposase
LPEYPDEADDLRRRRVRWQAQADPQGAFLIETDQVVPWKGLIALIEPHYPKGEGGRPAYPLTVMLRVHLMQNWFDYSDSAIEEALYETTILRQFADLSLERIPDETTILNFRRQLEKHELAAGILVVINGYLGDRGLSLRQGTIVDATLIHAPSSTKNKDGKRDPEMHQTKKGNQYFFSSATCKSHGFLFRRLTPNGTDCSTTRALPRHAWTVTAGSEALGTM